ncbi:F-box domain-containing protein [Mycena sanguinolenta]|uniref:F-box domain-containing protein n=1 Tax=Mycena sanguinolenta TaxID=230812 RepID=A0A8H6Z5D9_9AGAR|nr:F-box domain-containing protein [Mycena sanguinolenta]
MAEMFSPAVFVLGTWHHALVNSNEPPDVSESVFIQSVISRTDERLARLEDEKLKLERMINHLDDPWTCSCHTCPSKSQLQDKLDLIAMDRLSLSNYRMRNKATLSPLRRMPAELLDEIFLWTCEFSNRRALSRGKFDLVLPWVLTWVSSRWRAVAISSPSLWSLVLLDFSSQTPNMLPQYLLPLVEARIQRSQKLRIHFYGSHATDARPQTQMLELLSRHASQWEELSIGIVPGIIPLLASLRDRLTSLKRLWIQWEGSESQKTECIDCFHTASSLVDVGIFNEYSFIPTTYPTHLLTRYQLDGPWKTHRGLLKAAPNLVEARIEISFDQWEADSEEIVHLLLQRLYISHPNVLPSLTLPSLEGVAFWVANEDNIDLPKLLASFVDRSACPLQRLCLRGFPNAEALVQVLQRVPSIAELVIINSEPEAFEQINAIIKALTVSESRTVAPQLRRLFFGCEEKTFVDYAAYLEMLRSRWKSADCMLTGAALLIDSGPRPGRATRRGLHALRLEGLDLVLAKGPQAGNDVYVWAYAVSWN